MQTNARMPVNTLQRGSSNACIPAIQYAHKNGLPVHHFPMKVLVTFAGAEESAASSVDQSGHAKTDPAIRQVHATCEWHECTQIVAKHHGAKLRTQMS
jgi:hypothetical protein